MSIRWNRRARRRAAPASLPRAGGRAAGAVRDEGRVEVDHVRHHGRAEDAGRDDADRAVRPPGHEALGEGDGVDAGAEGDVPDPDDDHGEQARDHELEPPVAGQLQPEQRERDSAGHEATEEQRHAEEDLQRDGAADHLGDVGRHHDELGLRPQQPDDPGRVPVTAELGEIAPGRQAELGGQALHEDGHHVGRDDDPHQGVPGDPAGGEVRREVARVDVGDGSDESGAQQEQPGAQRLRRQRAGSAQDGDVGVTQQLARLVDGHAQRLLPVVAGTARSCSRAGCQTAGSTSYGA